MLPVGARRRRRLDAPDADQGGRAQRPHRPRPLRTAARPRRIDPGPGAGRARRGDERILQGVSDPFLGFFRGERDYYVRQFRDMKGGIDAEALDDELSPSMPGRAPPFSHSARAVALGRRRWSATWGTGASSPTRSSRGRRRTQSCHDRTTPPSWRRKRTELDAGQYGTPACRITFANGVNSPVRTKARAPRESCLNLRCGTSTGSIPIDASRSQNPEHLGVLCGSLGGEGRTLDRHLGDDCVEHVDEGRQPGRSARSMRSDSGGIGRPTSVTTMRSVCPASVITRAKAGCRIPDAFRMVQTLTGPVRMTLMPMRSTSRPSR